MISTLLDSSVVPTNYSTIFLIVIIALFAIFCIITYIKRKKFNNETIQMLDSLKPGDKVKTYAGIYGTIVSIRETTDGKVVVLQLGDEDHVSYLSIDANAVYCLDKKQDIVYDAEGNVLEPVMEKDATEEVEQEPETVVENSEEIAEQKKVKAETKTKKTAKKSTKKAK